MTRHLFVFMLILCSGWASETAALFELYQKGRYLEACDKGVKMLGKHTTDEKFVSVYAFSCLNADKIDRLALPIILLKGSKEARKNAAYFSAILLQKNLLISALENDEKLSDLSLPTTDYALSKVFDLYVRGTYKRRNRIYVFPDPEDKRRVYKLTFLPDERTPKIIIEEYYDTILTEQHTYF